MPSEEKMLPVESELSTTVPGDMRERGSPDKSEEKEEIQKMATHSCSLAWELPWTEERGGLKFMGSQSPHDLTIKRQQGISESKRPWF